jgi:hypothetical protein
MRRYNFLVSTRNSLDFCRERGLTEILYQRDGEFIASAPPDLEGLGTGWKSAVQAGDSPVMSEA